MKVGDFGLVTASVQEPSDVPTKGMLIFQTVKWNIFNWYLRGGKQPQKCGTDFLMSF